MVPLHCQLDRCFCKITHTPVGDHNSSKGTKSTICRYKSGLSTFFTGRNTFYKFSPFLSRARVTPRLSSKTFPLVRWTKREREREREAGVIKPACPLILPSFLPRLPEGSSLMRRDLKYLERVTRFSMSNELKEKEIAGARFKLNRSRGRDLT